MEVKSIKELINAFNEAELTSLSLKCQEFELQLEKKQEVVQEISRKVSIPEGNTEDLEKDSLETKKENPENVKHEDLTVQKTINSPMVGTFYISPGPNDPPFVQVGSHVEKGDVICIIEAMKLMNEVVADQAGEIVEILVNNEDMVEFDQPMFVIR